MTLAQLEFAQQAPATKELMSPKNPEWWPHLEVPCWFLALLTRLIVHFGSVIVGDRNHSNSLQDFPAFQPLLKCNKCRATCAFQRRERAA